MVDNISFFFLLLLKTHSPNSNPIAMTPHFTDKTTNTGHMPTRGQEGHRNLVESKPSVAYSCEFRFQQSAKKH